MATYAFSDLHACDNLWQQIKEYIKPTDVVFCLGDCVDRGDAGLKILNEVLETPNITLLRGNHEDFIIHMGKRILQMGFCWGDPHISLWLLNGADQTIDDFMKLSKKNKKKLIKTLEELPTHIEYTNKNNQIIYLTHAGRTPNTKEIPNCDKWALVPTNNYTWDREHIKSLKWDGRENEYAVHGHTPVQYMSYFLPEKLDVEIPQSRFEIFKYCEGHKINIDLCSVDTHRACLLNLDTFEPIYFKDQTIDADEWKRIEEGVE